MLVSGRVGTKTSSEMSVSHEILGGPPAPPTLGSFGAPTMSRGPCTQKSLQFNPSAGKLKHLQT